jgi:hypothetical protein
MSHRTHRSTRREFLRQSSALGLAAASPLLLTHCGGSGDDTSPGTPAAGRETHHLHFDLSHAPIAQPTLFALNSRHHAAALLPHDADSRQRHRALNPLLAQVPDAKLTHYLEDADLPADALQSIHVHGVHPDTGAPLMAGAFLHVPNSARAVVAQRALAQGKRREASAKMRAYGLEQPQTADVAGSAPDNLQDLATPFDTACYLVFHHPEVMNLKADLGAEILSRIENSPCSPTDPSCAPYIGTLAFKIATLNRDQGYPSTAPGSWATLVPMTQLDGTPALDDEGQPVYRYEISDELDSSLALVLQAILKDIFDDPLFKGTNWHATKGLASHPVRTPVSRAAAAAAEAITVTAEHGVGTTFHGIEMVELEVADPATRTVRVTIRNTYLRFLSVYVQYQDVNGTALPIANPSEEDTTRAQHLAEIPTNDQIMGIPLMGTDVEKSNLQFVMPDAASRAQLKFGSLGLGGDPFCPEALTGASLTLALNIGLPTMLLALGIVADFRAGSLIDAIFGNATLLKTLVKSLKEGLRDGGFDVAEGIYSSSASKSIVPFITGIANIALQTLLSAAPRFTEEFFKWIALQIGKNTILKLLPFVGVAYRALSVAADLLAISFSISESLLCPPIANNTVSLSTTTTVRVKKDPRDFQFPVSATTCNVEATYDGGAVPRTASAALVQGRVDPLDVVLEGVPSGGKVSFKVSLLSDDGCLVGTATVGPIVNVPANTTTVEIEIVELVAALKPNTQYQHTRRLAYRNGARTWLALPAPELTRVNLCQGSDDAICDLRGITVHTATGMAGYGFQAGGQGLSACGGGGSGVLETIQNVFLGDNPERGLKFVGCGYAQPVGIVYDPNGPASGGHHFFVQPSDDGFHVRSAAIDSAAPFDLAQTKSWGRFTQALDSLAVLPSGYVVGVNRQTHKMEVLLLPAQPVDQAAEPQAVPFAVMKGGQGTRAGLLDTPVAVAGFRGAVLVLEQGNARVQAFDPSGNPVNLFANATTNLMPLHESTGVTYLDLAVEGEGYMYVLSYTGAGQTPGQYRVDVYTPDGALLCRTSSVAAARLAVDLFRNLYTLNYEPLIGSPRIEPTLSQWRPVTPGECPTTLPPPATSTRQAALSCASVA